MSGKKEAKQGEHEPQPTGMNWNLGRLSLSPTSGQDSQKLVPLPVAQKARLTREFS